MLIVQLAISASITQNWCLAPLDWLSYILKFRQQPIYYLRPILLLWFSVTIATLQQAISICVISMHVGTNVCDQYLKLTIIYQQSSSITCLSIIVVNFHQAYLIVTSKHYLLMNLKVRDMTKWPNLPKSMAQSSLWIQSLTER